MKKIFALFTLIIVLFFYNNSAYAQLLNENFDYITGTSLTSNGWIAYSSGGSNPVLVSSGSLSYTNYPSSGIGNSATVTGSSSSSEDVKKTFTAQTSGSVYASFLVNFSKATTAADGDYFLGFFTSTGSTAKGRVFVKKSGSNMAFGISKAGTVPVLSGFNYLLNTTYLLVLKYTFNASSSDDVVSLFIDPDLSGSEPTPNLINTDTSTDLSNVGAIFLRQGGTAYSLVIDGIRVATSWSQAPLPVELTSFSASAVGNNVELNWATATEVNNYGFEVQRSVISVQHSVFSVQRSAFEKIGFVEGHGNSNSPNNYSFTDNNVSYGKYAYRLKQIDTDGKYTYSKIVEVQVGQKPTAFALDQNYPNPFNPTTTITYKIAEQGFVNLKVYNILGQKVLSLVNQQQQPGVYHVRFNGSKLPSGVYIYRLEVKAKNNSFSALKKFVLLK